MFQISHQSLDAGRLVVFGNGYGSVFRIMTDQLHAYMTICKSFASHESVHHEIKEFARGEVHVNTEESSNVIFGRVKLGIFHYINRPHTPHYLSEVAFH